MKARILVIDDDEGLRLLLQTKLFQQGFNVTVAANGLHALQKIRSSQEFDLILCDLKMMGMSGVDFVKSYTSLGRSTPILMLTGYPDRDKVINAAQLGVREILIKPISHNDLIAKIRAYLKPADDSGGQPAA